MVKYTDAMFPEEELYRKLWNVLISLYDNLEKLISEHAEFKTTLNPWCGKVNDGLGLKMLKYSRHANVGPMASVAGVFADEILYEAKKYVGSVFVENGGDIALENTGFSYVRSYLGTKDDKNTVVMKLPPGDWGVASSSGRFGHSLSLGQADLISVVAENANRADCYATAIANKIVPGCDPLELLEMYSDLSAVLVIWNDNIWYKGEFELSFA